jgi:hypothetical protein
MQINYAVHSATNTIDIVLERGAEKLYDRYLSQKLPDHTHSQNHALFNRNINLHEVAKPIKEPIETVPFTIADPISIDQHAPKRISIKKQQDGYSTLSPKNTTFCRSTKYQTIISDMKSTGIKNPTTENQNNSLNFEDPLGDITALSFSKERPMTMQTGRKTQREHNLLMLDSKVDEVEEKRAATCHTRKRKRYVSGKEKMSNMVKIRDEGPIMLHE